METEEINLRIPLISQISENSIYGIRVSKRKNGVPYGYMYLYPAARVVKDAITKFVKDTLDEETLNQTCKYYIGDYKLECNTKRFDITNSLKPFEDSVIKAFKKIDDMQAKKNTIEWVSTDNDDIILVVRLTLCKVNPAT